MTARFPAGQALDLTFPRRDGTYYVIIDCGEAQVLMAYLKTGSLLVSTGQKVLEGQPVGRIGNSGNTMEPHLHIEASREGKPISLRFDGRVLVVNSVIQPGSR